MVNNIVTVNDFEVSELVNVYIEEWINENNNVDFKFPTIHPGIFYGIHNKNGCFTGLFISQNKIYRITEDKENKVSRDLGGPTTTLFVENKG